MIANSAIKQARIGKKCWLLCAIKELNMVDECIRGRGYQIPSVCLLREGVY